MTEFDFDSIFSKMAAKSQELSKVSTLEPVKSENTSINNKTAKTAIDSNKAPTVVVAAGKEPSWGAIFLKFIIAAAILVQALYYYDASLYDFKSYTEYHEKRLSNGKLFKEKYHVVDGALSYTTSEIDGKSISQKYY